MSQEQVNNLFKIDGCYSTHGTNKERGTGLGLVVVKEFVEINHGSISISSICGAGTTVSISLPTYRNAEA
jgi:signal transduction histidine kinase